MKIPKAPLIYIFLLVFSYQAFAQDSEAPAEKPSTTLLFSEEAPLPIKLKYSNKVLRRETNDSTYLESVLEYEGLDGEWKVLDVKLRARGNYRRENCYFPPVKIKIKKKKAKGTLFEGNKELKLVLPCRLVKDCHDYVLKEYMAYKLYEEVTPYHFKTRPVTLELTEIKGNKEKKHQLMAFLIEDIDKVAERHGARKLKRVVHPLQQDNICSVQNDFFQYMIGNTDFSVAYQHNEKLIFVTDRKAIPIPYDFDMSGLVNANYAVVSQIENETLSISKVTDRLFRGFKRNESVYEFIRQDFLGKKADLLGVIDGMESEFQDPRQFKQAREFIEDFFVVLQSETKFQRKILAMARVK